MLVQLHWVAVAVAVAVAVLRHCALAPLRTWRHCVLAQHPGQLLKCGST
jgi:hypothetical protein